MVRQRCRISLGSQCANNTTQVELIKKCEGGLEQIIVAHECTLAALRQKHNNTNCNTELGEQIDSLDSNKIKAEKDKAWYGV